ncbi:MAG TPA: hypothetical protein VN864_03515 [Thermoplasmata archaeon]|nr:hypothetical protein [Thermoplasmata archaeon]
MPIVPLPELDRLAHDLAQERHGTFSERALGRAYEEYLARRRTPLGPVRLRADGRDFSTFYDLVADPSAGAESLELWLDPAPPAGPAWEFLRPFERILFAADGSAEVFSAGTPSPTRAIARFLLREHYLPRTEAEEDRAAGGGPRVALPTTMRSWQEGVGACRSRGLLPFSVAVLLYFADERIAYEIDLVRSVFLADVRAGRLAPARRVRRSARLSWSVDRAVGRGDLPLLAARALSVLVESQGLTAVEMTHVFGGVRETVDSALQGLAARGFASFDRRTATYRPHLDTFLPPPPASGHVSSAPIAESNPALRTSVQELIAAADARASCPLCGDPLPPGTRGILCDRCAAEVGAG